MEYVIGQVTVEQKQRIEQDVMQLTGIAHNALPEWFELTVISGIGTVLNYCNREDIPDRGLELMTAGIIAEQVKARQRDSQISAGGVVKSVSQGDSSVSYETAAKTPDYDSASWSFAAYTGQLNRYRRLPKVVRRS